MFCFVSGKSFKLAVYSGKIPVSEKIIWLLLVYIQNGCKFWIIILNLWNLVSKDVGLRMNIKLLQVNNTYFSNPTPSEQWNL